MLMQTQAPLTFSPSRPLDWDLESVKVNILPDIFLDTRLKPTTYLQYLSKDFSPFSIDCYVYMVLNYRVLFLFYFFFFFLQALS